jgi:hypothetical protein
MKKKLMLIMLTVFFVACLPLVMAGSAQAVTSFTGSTFMSAAGFNSVAVTTSTNVYLLYNPNANGLTYGAYTKNKAGDKYYATGGGGGTSSGIYFMQSDSYIGDLSFPSMSSTSFVSGAGWTAQ